MSWCRLALLFFLFPLLSSAVEPEGVQPIEIITGRFDYPREAKLRGMDGYAKAIIEVAETGQLMDVLVVEASHDYFAQGAEDLLRRSIFRPARENGQAIPLRTEVSIEFQSDGIIVNSDFQTIVDLYLQGGHARDHSFRLATLKELDRIPVPIQVEPPPFPTELAKAGVVGQAMIDFYIDREGRVRMPAIATDDHEELGTIALNAVRSWRFEPPMRDGYPVAVRVRQEFRFREGSPVAESGQP